MAKPSESEVDALLATARATRKRPSRNLWIAALVVSVLCVAGLAYALIIDWNAEPDRASLKDAKRSSGSGFTVGLVIGIGAGIAIGSLIAVRRRQDS